jgi:hypothetical protein
MHFSLSLPGSIAVAAAVATLTGAPANCAAQSLFEALFGPAKPKSAVPYPGNADRLLPPGGVNSGAPYGSRQMPPPRRDDDDDDRSSSKAERGGGHHTVCVRLCDGFYWPVSFAAPRSRLYRDATACSASCGAEAKLFHYSANGGQINDAVDLTGRVYSRLPTAFKYRKAVVPGCACKPAPWSLSEIDRHRMYALDESAAKEGAGTAAAARRSASHPLPPPSGIQESVVVGDAADADDGSLAARDAAAQPPPVERRAARIRPPASDAGVAGARTPPPGPRPRAAPATAPPPAGSNGWWGGGAAATYTWPGDPPARVR